MPMGPAAVMGDKATGVCTHIFMVPSPAGPVPTPLPAPWSGTIMGNCITTVLIGNKPAAVLGSTLQNLPPHVPTPPGTAFGPPPPTNDGKVIMGSATVMIGGKPAARMGDMVQTCTNSAPPVPGSITGPCVATVIVGG